MVHVPTILSYFSNKDNLRKLVHFRGTVINGRFLLARCVILVNNFFEYLIRKYIHVYSPSFF